MRCLDSEDSDNLPGDTQREVCKLVLRDKLRFEVSPGDTSDVFGQV